MGEIIQPLRRCTVRCRWGNDLWDGKDPLRPAEQDIQMNSHYSGTSLAGNTIPWVRYRLKLKTMSLATLYLRPSMLANLYAVIADIRTCRLSQIIFRASIMEPFESRFCGRQQDSKLSQPARPIPRVLSKFPQFRFACGSGQTLEVQMHTPESCGFFAA